MNIWYINVTCDDNFVFSFPRLLLLNKSKCSKSTVMYDPTYESRDITRSRNHVINHCRKLEMAYELILFINWSTYRESILIRSRIQIDLIVVMTLLRFFDLKFSQIIKVKNRRWANRCFNCRRWSHAVIKIGKLCSENSFMLNLLLLEVL